MKTYTTHENYDIFGHAIKINCSIVKQCLTGHIFQLCTIHVEMLPLISTKYLFVISVKAYDYFMNEKLALLM